MGLRINTNVASLTALRNLGQADIAQQRSLERLSTGLRINRAADDPAGLVISEQLRAQIQGVEQALRNAEDDSNLIGTAEAALDEVSKLLIDVRDSAVFALNTGGNSAEQIAAEQDGVNAAIDAINRIGSSTRFGTRNLLDGSSDFRISAISNEITGINLRSIDIDGALSRTLNVVVATAATQASQDSGTDLTVAIGTATIQVTGNRGTVTLDVTGSGTDFERAVNDTALQTGVWASNDGTSVFLKSLDFGTDGIVVLKRISGTYSGTEFAFGSITGVNFSGTIDGLAATGNGLTLSVRAPQLDVDVTFSNSGVAAGTFNFAVQKSGLTFQLGASFTPEDNINVGLRAINAGILGSTKYSISLSNGATVNVGGRLSEIRSGGAHDLDTDPGHALEIIDEVIDQVSGLRSFLGATQANIIDSNIRSNSVALENLEASESQIRDLDFAAETANFTKVQILFQASTAVLASANLIPQTVLTLLQ